MKITNELYDIIEETKKDKTKAYDTPAEVTRTEGSTLWVHIPGGVQETPIKKTVNASPGDTVQVRVSGGTAWVVGNASAPPTDDTTALKAEADATSAAAAAGSALRSATTAREAADEAETQARAASTAAVRAEGKADAASAAADRADDKADDAADAAESAQASAVGALNGLSTVQDVLGVLDWAQQNATFTQTQDTEIEPGKVYWTYNSTTQKYEPVPDPSAAALSTYYEISGVDEAMADYISAHLALTSEGLWILPNGTSGSGFRVLIATGGSGHTYETAGMYIIDGSGNIAGKFLQDSAQIGEVSRAHSVIDANGQRFYGRDGSTLLANIGYGETYGGDGTIFAPYYTFGSRRTVAPTFDSTSTYNIGDLVYYGNPEKLYVCITEIDIPGAWNPYDWMLAIGEISFSEGAENIASGRHSHAEGYSTKAIAPTSHSEGERSEAFGDSAHAEGYTTNARGACSHAEGGVTNARGDYSHAEGMNTTADGMRSHAQGYFTIAAKDSQTAIGKYNIEDTETTASKQKAFIIGNGTGNNARSNAFSVDWEGYTEIAGDLWADGSIEADGDINCNGNMSPAGDLLAGGNVEDGNGNVLADKADASSIPTKTSDLTNDGDGTSPFATLDDIPAGGGGSTFYGTNSQSGTATLRTVDVADTSFALERGVIVAVKFTNGVPSAANLNVNSTGSKAIYYHGAAIVLGKIQAGDLVTFQYDGSYWNVLAIDRQPTKTSELTNDSGFLSGTGLFKIVDLEVTNSAQIAAHGYQAAATYTVPAASRPSGMTLVGIVGYGTSNYRLQSTTHFVNGSNSIYANMANTSATAVSAGAKITFKLLYIKATSA